VETLLVVGMGNPVAADYAAYVNRQGGRNVVLADTPSGATFPAATEEGRVPSVVLFLSPRLADRSSLDALPALLQKWGTEFVGIVSTFRVHLGDRDAAETEAHVLARLEGVKARAVVFRAGHILSNSSRAGVNLRRFGSCYPLVPARLKSCCVDGDELFAAVESERHNRGQQRTRVFTLLGPNQSWRALLARHRPGGVLPLCLTVLSTLLSLLLVGHAAALVLGLLARRRPTLRRWNFDTLRPRSMRELLALYNPYNYRHVKVVGYNNGVCHFGHRYPGRTIVSTVHCDRVVWTGEDVIKADCGTTIRKALDFLSGAGQDLYVIPNYSYVCLGTAFFVPIHGSAADYSAVAETITKVVLYDPAADRLIVTTHDEPAFRDHAYDQKSDVLLLRLYLRVKPKSRFFIRKEEAERLGSDEILSTLRDSKATNVEVRKSVASSDKVQVCKFYKDAGTAPGQALELPRDSLGRLWDRLEENPVTSFLMHSLTRHLAWHCELFFTAEEFATFWETHRELPLRKIQLRYLKRDGFTHSPFRDHDCVSADMFMFRRHRRAFEAYLKRTFAVVRSNPGKHSR
jgi:hypothetical protein